jgi:hypothetical protein
MSDPNGVPSRHLLDRARQIGLTVTPATLARWHRDGLLPLPTVRSLGRGRGTETLYPNGTEDQFVELCKFRMRNRSLDRAAWSLWWKGFTLPAPAVRPLLEEVLENLLELEAFAVRLGEDDGSAPDEVYDAAWEKFERLLRRCRRRVAARLARKLGFLDWKELLRVGLRVITGTFVGPAELSNEMITAFVSVVPGIAWNRSMLVAALRETMPALRVSLLCAALDGADLNELNQARDEVRVLICVLDGSFTCLFRKIFGADAGEERFGALVDDDEVAQRYLVLLWLAHRRHPAARFAIRGLMMELARPEVRAWLESK